MKRHRLCDFALWLRLAQLPGMPGERVDGKAVVQAGSSSEPPQCTHARWLGASCRQPTAVSG